MSSKLPHFFVLSSPSGGGKTTLLRHLLAEDLSLRLSVSCTTRPPRPGETPGRDYSFISHSEFQQRIERGDLLEWERVHGEYYGTPKAELQGGSGDLIFDVDTKGAFSIKRLYPQTTLIFIQPPSLEELARRLRHRGTEDPVELKRRLENFRQEMAAKDQFDYVIINDTVERAVGELREIIARHRSV